MQSIFIKHSHGDFVRADMIALVSHNPCDPSVKDDQAIAATMTGGFGFNVRCGDLRRALGIVFDEVPAK